MAGKPGEPCQGWGLPRTWIGSPIILGQEPDQMFVNGADGLFISKDMGQTWHKETTGRAAGFDKNGSAECPTFQAGVRRDRWVCVCQ